MRNNGTELDRREWLAERKAIYEDLYPETKQGTNQHSRVRKNYESSPQRFTQDTAKKTNISESSVQKKVRTATTLPQDIRDDIRDTPIADSGVELDALTSVASQAPDVAKKVVGQVKRGEMANVRTAIKQHKKQERARELQAHVETLDTTSKTYRIIYADPPWRYNEEQHSDIDNVLQDFKKVARATFLHLAERLTERFLLITLACFGVQSFSCSMMR